MSVQVIRSILGGLGRRLGLSRVTRRIAQAARTLRPAPAIQVVEPAATGKTTLVQYLGHPPRPDEPVSSVGPPRPGRLAADWSEGPCSWFRSKLIDDGHGQQTHGWAGRLKRSNPEGVIVVVDTHYPDDDHAYVQTLYHSYRDVSAHATRVKLRVLLILLNKFDRWGNTTAAREAMMQRYRTEVFPEVVNRFRSHFGVTVQFGYASLTQPAPTPYNHLIVKEFLTVLNQDLQHGSCDTTSFVPLGTLSCWSGGVRISFMLRASGHWLHVRANRASRSVYRDALAPRTP